MGGYLVDSECMDKRMESVKTEQLGKEVTGWTDGRMSANLRWLEGWLRMGGKMYVWNGVNIRDRG
jgi:hypothetical protein